MTSIKASTYLAATYAFSQSLSSLQARQKGIESSINAPQLSAVWPDGT